MIFCPSVSMNRSIAASSFCFAIGPVPALSTSFVAAFFASSSIARSSLSTLAFSSGALNGSANRRQS